MALNSDTNQVQLSMGEETTWGTQVADTTSLWTVQRYTGSPGFGLTNRYTQSKEIVATRDIADNILVDKDVAGTVNFELSFRSLDMVLEGALFNDWTQTGLVVNTSSDSPISDVADTEIITCGSHSFVVGSLVMLSGFTTAANNTTAPTRVTAADDTTITVTQALTTEGSAIPVGATIREVGFEGASGDIAASATGPSLTSSTLDFTTFPIAVGDWIKIGGSGSESVNKFATAACNGWARVSAITAHAITLDRYPTGFTTDAGSSKCIQVFFGDKITNSTTAKSYSIEQKFDDHSTDDYGVHLGCKINTLNFEINQADIVKGSWTVIGKGSTYGTIKAVTTPTAAPTNDVLSATDDIGSIKLDNTEVATPNYILKASISINNNLRKQTAVANLGAVGVGAGRCAISGTLQTYFGDTTILAYVTGNTDKGIAFVFEDEDNHAFVIDIPRINLSGGAPDVSGIDADVTVDMPFTASKHPTLGYSIKIQQFHYFIPNA